MKEKALLLLGPEEGDKRERWLAEKNMIFSANPDCEMETFYATEDIDKSLIASLRQPSLFASMRLVVVKYMESPRASLIKNITEYLKDPEEGVYLVMFSSDMKNPFPASVKNLESQIFYEDFDSNKMKWIRERFQKEGFGLSTDAVEEIMQSVTNNKAEMQSLIQGIASYYRAKDSSKRSITADDIAAVVSREKGEDGHTLFKAIAKRDLEGALLILNAINLQDPRNLITALIALSNDFRQAETFQKLIKVDRMDIRNALNQSVALQTMFPLQRISMRRRDEFVAASNNYSPVQIRDIIAYLTSVDTDIKTGGSEAMSLFETVVYNIIVNNGLEPDGEVWQDLFPKLS